LLAFASLGSRPRNWARGGLLVRAAVGLTLLVATDAVSEQHPPDLSMVTLGSKVRLLAPTVAEGRVEGVVLQADQEFLTVSGKRPDPLRVSRQAITHLEINTGRRGHALKGMWIGGLTGAVWAGSHPCVNEGCAEGFSVEFAVYGGLLGGLSGAGIGALIKTDRWTEVPPDRVHVGLAPVRGRGVALCVSVAY
jgi:hypothetical protein